MNKIKKGDNVMVLAGNDKGKSGEVRDVKFDAGGKPEKVKVEGIRMMTHFVRPNPQKNEPGGIIKREGFIHASSVAVVEAESGKPARVRIVSDADKGRRREFYVSNKRRG